MTDCSWKNPKEKYQETLNRVPELVYCKDCRFWDMKNRGCKKKSSIGDEWYTALDFCSKGARKGGLI